MRLVDQRARDRHSLLFAAGQLLGEGVEPVLEAHPLQDLVGPTALLLDRLSEHTQGKRDVFEHRLGGDELEVLEDKADGPAVGLHFIPRQPGQVPSAHDDFPFCRTLLQEQQPQQRALARAAGAGEEDELTLVDLQREIAQGIESASVGLAEPLRLDHGW